MIQRRSIRLICSALLVPLAVSLLSCAEDVKTEESAAGEDTPASSGLIISPDTVDDFAVIRGDMSEDAVTKAALRLKDYLTDETGLKLKISTDWDKNPIYRYEVIVGPTLRPSQLGDDVDMVSVGKRGFTVKCADGKLYVGGAGAQGTNSAVEWVIDNIRAENGTITVEDGFEHTESQHYDLKGIYVCGENTAGWPIAYLNAGDRSAAILLRDRIYDSTGVWHETVSGDYDGKAFKLGYERPKTKGLYYIKVSDGSLMFDSSASGTIDALIDIFSYEYLDYSGNINFPEEYEYVDLGDNMIVSNLE